MDSGSEPELHAACQAGDVAAVQDLLAGGAEIESQNSRGFTPLHAAAYAGQEQAVQALLNRGASPASVDADNRTPLHRAVQEAHENVVRMLIAAAKDLDAKDVYGLTPLHLAVRVAWWDAKGMKGIAEALLSGGADPAAMSFSGKKAVDEAADVGDESLLDVLRKAPDPECKPVASLDKRYVRNDRGPRS